MCHALWLHRRKPASEKIDNLSVRSVRQRDHTSLMNELPAIRSPCPRKDPRDRHGTNTATRQKEIHGERLFRRPKKKMERDKRFFPEVPSQMINNDVDAWEVKFFIRIPTKYVIKYTDKLLSLRKIYCEIVIA